MDPTYRYLSLGTSDHGRNGLGMISSNISRTVTFTTSITHGMQVKISMVEENTTNRAAGHPPIQPRTPSVKEQEDDAMPIVFFLVSSEFHLLGISVAKDSLSHVSRHRDAGDWSPNDAAGICDYVACGICGHDVLDVSTHRGASWND